MTPAQRARLPADPADFPPHKSNRLGHRNVYWSKPLQRYSIEVKSGDIRKVRYAPTLPEATEIARELRRELFGFSPLSGA